MSYRRYYYAMVVYEDEPPKYVTSFAKDEDGHYYGMAAHDGRMPVAMTRKDAERLTGELRMAGIYAIACIAPNKIKGQPWPKKPIAIQGAAL